MEKRAMNEWLQKVWEKSNHPFARGIVLFLSVFLSVLGLASVISDTGFAQEVQDYRKLVWIGSTGMALLVTVGWLHFRKHKRIIDLRNLADQLEKEISDLMEERDRLIQERESAFRLMELYKAQTQEDIINQLQRIAMFCIMQEQWRKKGAKVERLRTEEAVESIGGEGADFEIVERITVIINLGTQDKVLKSIRFIVQDPTDSHEYGVIEVREVHQNGATCRILNISDVAFWSDAVEAAQEGRPCISEVSANVIVPDSALKEISPESAKQLLVWLQSISRVEL